MDKETKLRSILFFVVGFLLVLSLVICIYIIAGERDLEPVEATVISVDKDAKKTGVNEIKINYQANGAQYTFRFDSKKDYQLDDVINVYYHRNKVTDVQTYKTSKLIFLCPIIGLVLCALGIFELYKRRGDGEDEFKTSIIGVVGDTQQLKIVTEGNDEPVYEPTPEEVSEVEVKSINKPVDEDVPLHIDNEVPYEEEEEMVPEEVVQEDIPAPLEEVPVPQEAPVMVAADEVPVAAPVEEPAPEPKEEVQQETPTPVVANVDEPPVIENVKETGDTPAGDLPKKNTVEAEIMKKVKEKSGDKIELSEEDLKEAIKDVLADVIKEVKKEKKPKKVEQVRVLPNYYYISGTSLMYEEAGKEQKELSLKNVKKVVRTVNEAGSVVKLTVESDEVKCILTNMKNIDLEQLSNLLRNKMCAMDENFEEVVEHKEY